MNEKTYIMKYHIIKVGRSKNPNKRLKIMHINDNT